MNNDVKKQNKKCKIKMFTFCISELQNKFISIGPW